MVDSLQSPVAPPQPETPARSGLVVTPICAALSFLTILPCPRRSFSALEMGRAVAYFPLVGLLIGALVMFVAVVVLARLPYALAAALTLVFWVVLTGALHLDGFLDCCDGLFAPGTPEKRLNILRDPRHGSYAIVGGVLLLLVKYQALLELPQRVPTLLLAPVLGRWSMVLAIVLFPYARSVGLGRDMKQHARWPHLLFASLIPAGLIAEMASWVALAAAFIAIGVTLMAAWLAVRRIGGLTGDVYGAICELVETAVLLTIVVGGMP